MWLESGQTSEAERVRTEGNGAYIQCEDNRRAVREHFVVRADQHRAQALDCEHYQRGAGRRVRWRHDVRPRTVRGSPRAEAFLANVRVWSPAADGAVQGADGDDTGEGVEVDQVKGELPCRGALHGDQPRSCWCCCRC